MTLEQYIAAFENNSFNVEVDTWEILSLLKELRLARRVIKSQAAYIESHIDAGR